MGRCGLVYDERYLLHDTGNHPESPLRLSHTMGHLEASGVLEALERIEPTYAPPSTILSVHTPEYVERLRELVRQGTPLDVDTPLSSFSLDAALLAAGGLLIGLERALDGVPVFALIRPPGHHATRDRGMGFCLLNSPAIAAQHALDCGVASRVLIIDFDHHHGNGTQDIFYHTSKVLYMSTHCAHAFPGTGAMEELGEGDGEGFTVNLPLSAGSGDVEYALVYRDVVLPIAIGYEPDVVIVSAGFDIHRNDPLGRMSVTERGICAVASTCLSIAEQCCGGRVVFELEGGYHLDALARSVEVVVRQMLSEHASPPEHFVPEMEERVPSSVRALEEKVRAVFSQYWEF